MDFIVEVYKVERAALDNDLLGTPQHLEMRQARSAQVMEEFRAWLEAAQPQQLPKGPMGEAINYALEPPRDLRRPVYWSPAPMAGVS